MENISPPTGEPAPGRKTLLDWQPCSSILLGPQAPIVQMKIGGHPIDLMVNMGVEHSVVTQAVGPFPKSIQLLTGIQGAWPAALL
jgi:hypothetical protein